MTTPTPNPAVPQIVDEAALRRSVRTLITVADNVRRGAYPPRVLDRMVAPQVAEPIAAELPASSGVSEVRTVLLQQPDPLTTYFTGTAQRPDGTAVAYLGTIGRTSERDRWQITQVLPVTERTIGLPLPLLPGEIGADPDRTQRFRDLVTAGYLDPAVQLLGPIPFEDAAQRHDWLDAATAIATHGQTHELGYTVITDLHHTPTDLHHTPTDPTPTWTEARQFIDAYHATYDVDLDRYADFAVRLDTLGGHDLDPQVGIDLEPGR